MSSADPILNMLRDELRRGQYVSGRRFPSEYQLARRFHVSRTTINKITDQLVSDGYLYRNKRGAGTMVLDPSPFPAGNIAYIGVIRPYYYRILDGCQKAALQKDFALHLFAPSVEHLNYCLDRVGHSKYIGLLVTGIGLLPASYPLPVLYLDSSLPDNSEGLMSVTCSNYQGAYDMAEAVLARGHREVLACSSGGIHSEFSRMKRMRGFRDAMAKHGINDVPNRLFWEPGADTAAHVLLKKMLSQYPRTTVIMTDSDDLMLELWKAARDLGHSEELTFTGFGNLSSVSGVYGFPSVEQHPEEIGIQGVNELLSRFENPEMFVPHEIEVETELVNTDGIPIL